MSVRAVILCSIFSLLLSSSVCAEIYSCRDKQGRIHVSDNLQTLPDECRAEARQLQATDPDNLHYVPDAGSVTTSDPRVEGFVREQQHRRQEREEAAERLLQKADELLSVYQQAQKDRRNAVRSWSYASRQNIQKAQQQIANVRMEKQQVLEELEQWRFSAETKDRIRRTLDGISDTD